MTTRLHISPLDPSLLEAILHRPTPESASFHTIPTFPENNYGFVSLPTEEAEKIMKKLNGAILKGKKLKIHEARSETRRSPDPETQTLNDVADAGLKESKKRKKEEKIADAPEEKRKKQRKARENVIDGYELPSDRHVKRGWTDPSACQRPRKSKDNKDGKKEEKNKKLKKSERSKYTEKPECLFQTKLPANKITATEEAHTAVEKAKKKKKNNNKSKSADVIVVHEFENLVTQPSFIRTDDNTEKSKLTEGFVEGKGWVDRRGNVKEDEPDERSRKPREIKGEKLDREYAKKMKRDMKKGEARALADKVEKKKKKKKKKKKMKNKQKAPTPPLEDDETSSSGSSSDSPESESEAEYGANVKELDIYKNATTEPTLSDSKSTSDSDSDSDTDVAQTRETTESAAQSSTVQPKRFLTAIALVKELTSKEAHPLELLFKKSVNPIATTTADASSAADVLPTDTNTGFKFFGDANDDDIDEDMNDICAEEPNTPFAQKQEEISRTIRSGAPTPDTIAGARFAPYNRGNTYEGEKEDGYVDDDDDDDDDDDLGGWGGVEETPSRANLSKKEKKHSVNDGKGGDEGETGEVETEFAKWFWENRGDNNRTWKRRRRETAKEKRQRENRAKGLRGSGIGIHTIIELDHFKSSAPGGRSSSPSIPDSNISCNDCTRKFCLEYAQPLCEGATEEDITTECFQRDSKKDRVIVYLFIFTTICLLAYAAVKPKADQWIANVRQKPTFMPLLERRIGA
ncbi:hypothetical protein KEM54_006098 [Ascosphaera aggregata]|nr:hypothetical protein KEM54_006098 [Ascosphaera aggregata]